MTSFGRYEILDKLGEGAMGVVYRARDKGLGRVVALKMLSAEGAEDELHKRFHREAEAVGRLDHPNVVKVFDLGQSDGQLYMAMELLEGEDLRSLIEAQADTPVVDRVRVLIEICQGLAYAHSRGVIHRDIKPANILVTTTGTVKILDFGLARVTTRATITRRGVILGTPDYMCPEQAMGRTVEPRSDMFSAGAVFYEFLTFQKPFLGRTLHSVLYQIISERPTAILTLNTEIPARLAGVVHRMLAKEPERRFGSMEEVGRELQAIHTALRTSRSRSALPTPAPALSAQQAEEIRARVREHLGRGRALFEKGDFQRAAQEMNEALALDPDAPEAAALLWRAWRRLRGGSEPAAADPAIVARVAVLLDQMAPGTPEAEARRALAELALIAPDDPRVIERVRERELEARR